MRASLLGHLKGASLKEYEMMRIEAVISKLVTDVETIDGFVSSTIFKLIVAVFFQYVLSIAKLACKRIDSIYEMEQEPEIEETQNPFTGKHAIDIVVDNLSLSKREIYIRKY